MKKFSVFLLFFSFFLFSCQTVPLETPEIEEYEPVASSAKPQMEFIGFKAIADVISSSSVVIVDSGRNNSLVKTTTTNISDYDTWKLFKDDSIIGNLGVNLEKKRIATDKSFAYFGIYSLQELELYKSQTRYVTFVQVNKNKLTWTGSDSRGSYALVGGTLLPLGLIFNGIGAAVPSKETDSYGEEHDNSGGKTAMQFLGVGLDAAGLITLLVGANKKVETKFVYEGNFDIFIYDTLNKEILSREEVNISQRQTFTGFYTDGDRQKVASYFGSIVSNSLMKKYEEINKRLNSYNN